MPVKFNPWFPEQETTDVENWKYIGVDVKRVHKRAGGKILVNYFAIWTAVMLGSFPGGP